MKLCTFTLSDSPDSSDQTGTPRLGAILPDDDRMVVDLARAFASSRPDLPPGISTDDTGTPLALRHMQACLEAGEPGFELIRRLLESADSSAPWCVSRTDVRLLAPLPRPRTLRDAMVFEGHFLQARRGGAAIKFPPIARLDAVLRRIGLPIIGVPRRFKEIPAYYKGNPGTVVGDGATVHWPAYTDLLDYELEVGFFIHRRGRDLKPGEALEHIAGYTIFNDFSARDIQIEEMDLGLGPAKGKDFDTGNAMGPFLVTPDEVGDPCDLKAVARVNGEIWTDSSTRGPQFSPGELLSYISRSETIHPGDFIGMGTVPNGCGLEHGRWLKPGDVVSLEVERLGTLTNPVARHATPGRPDE